MEEREKAGNGKVLLIEPNYKSFFLPLALAKISTYYKDRGYEVRYVKGSISFLNYEPTIIFITSLFTWDWKEVRQSVYEASRKYPNVPVYLGGICASLRPEWFEGIGDNVGVHKGLKPEWDELRPDFELFGVDYVVGYTTRGCVNKCPFCMVPKLEPEYKEIKDWDKFIKATLRGKGYNKIYLWDNNFLASSFDHITSVIDKLKSYRLPFDFNQGLDAQLFTEKIAEQFGRVHSLCHPLRFAYDNMRVDSCIQDAIKRAFKHKLNDISIYMLYNFLEKPAEIYNRMHKLAELDHSNRIYIFPMKYQDLNAKEKSEYIGKFWTEELLSGFRNLQNKTFSNGIIRVNNLAHFKEAFGNSSDDFLSRISGKKQGGDIRKWL